MLSFIPFIHLLHCQSPSLPTVLRDRIWIHKPIPVEDPKMISWPTFPCCSKWQQKGKLCCCEVGKGKLQEDIYELQFTLDSRRWGLKDRKGDQASLPLPSKINFVLTIGFWANDHFQLTPSVGKIN